MDDLGVPPIIQARRPRKLRLTGVEDVLTIAELLNGPVEDVEVMIELVGDEWTLAIGSAQLGAALIRLPLDGRSIAALSRYAALWADGEWCPGLTVRVGLLGTP